MELTAGQKYGKDLVEGGHNCFITGPGGVGKSTLMREITNKETLLCGPTGASALQIGGVTASSLFGLPIGVCLDSDRFKPARKAEEIFANGCVKRIIFDEVSMARADQFSLVDAKLRNITKRDVPFGGIQMVFVGDLYQLPPVLPKTEAKIFNKTYNSPWAFKTMAWEGANIQLANLDEVKRNGDVRQVRILQSIRSKDKYWGKAVDRINEISSQRPIDAIWLCSYNNTVDGLNRTRYGEIEGAERTYLAVNKGFNKRDQVVEDVLNLKEGCRVLIKANCKNGTYVNGTQGYVKELDDNFIAVETSEGDTVLVERFEWTKYDYVVGLGGLERKKVASFRQFPIKLGWAISIHGSQGSTLTSANIDLGSYGAFSAGQSYVALSRVKDLTRVFIQGQLNYKDIIVDPEVKEFYEAQGL